MLKMQGVSLNEQLLDDFRLYRAFCIFLHFLLKPGEMHAYFE